MPFVKNVYQYIDRMVVMLQVILDKNPSIKTVVNKVDFI